MRTLRTIFDDLKQYRVNPAVAIREAAEYLHSIPRGQADEELIRLMEDTFGPRLRQMLREMKGEDGSIVPPADPRDSTALWDQLMPFSGLTASIKLPKFHGRLRQVIQGYSNKPPIYRWNHPNLSVYIMAADSIYLIDPTKGKMSPDKYAATVLHEVIHSTGAANRCSRPWIVRGGMTGREQHLEEIIADMGMQMIGEDTGILTPDAKHWFDGHTYEYAAAFRKHEDRDIVQVRMEALPYAKAAAEYVLNRPLTVRLAKFVRGFQKGA